MTTYSCDICGKKAKYRKGYDFELDKVLPHLHNCKIVVSTRFYFKNHPDGFGGPPDLCGECFSKALESTLSYIQTELKK